MCAASRSSSPNPADKLIEHGFGRCSFRQAPLFARLVIVICGLWELGGLAIYAVIEALVPVISISVWLGAFLFLMRYWPS